MPVDRQMNVITAYPLPSINPKHKCIHFLYFNNFNTKTLLKWPSLFSKIRNYIEGAEECHKTEATQTFYNPSWCPETYCILEFLFPYLWCLKKILSDFVEKPYIEVFHCFYFYNSQSTDNLLLIFTLV